MKLTFLVPDHLKDITLGQYQQFEKLNTKENQDSVFLMQKMIEIFCGIKFELTLGFKYNDLVDSIKHITNILNEKPKLKNTFKLGKTQFGFIPNLDEITLGEYIDLDNYLGKWEHMHKAMSVLYRPVTKKKENRYLIEEYKGSIYSRVMKECPMDIVVGSMLFFYHLKNELINHSLNCLHKEIGTNLTSEQLKTLQKDGGGINQSLHSLEEILKDLNISQS
jgi:hypothetical protein